MADRKITDLTALAAGSQATGDLLTIVDVSEAAATDKNKKITVESLFKGIPGNVGIRTSLPTKDLQIGSFGGNDSNIQLAASTTGASNILFGDASDGDNWFKGFIKYAHSSDSLELYSSSVLKASTGGSERLRIDSSGRLLLGTTTEGEGNADNFTIADSGNCGITIRSGTSGAGNIFFSDGTSGSDEVRGSVEYNHASNFLKFNTDATERMRIDSSGRVLVGTSTARANLVVGLGSNTVPAAGAATASALFSNATGAGNYGLIAGATSGGVGYLQAQRADGVATTYNLAIQPNGGNVGIGYSSPNAKLIVYQGSDNATNVAIFTGGSQLRGLKLGTKGYNGYNDGGVIYNAQTGGTSGSHHFQVNNGNDMVKIDHHGLKFGSDTAAANALSDYEEGTFTPTPTFGEGLLE